MAVIDLVGRNSDQLRPRQEVGSFRDNVLVGLLLILVMLLGGYQRFTGLNWDDYIAFHPDERFLGQVSSAMGRPFSEFTLTGTDPLIREQQYQNCMERYPETAGQGGYFDAECSTWNPHNIGHGMYVYGTLPLFLTRIAAETMTSITGDADWINYGNIQLVWRFLSAVSEMATLALVFVLGVTLHNKWVGLIAATLYMGSAFAIQQAHFGTTDAMATTFVTLSLVFAARVQRNGSLIDYGWFGLACGAALASRLNVAPLAGIVIIAALVRLLPTFDGRLARSERERLYMETAIGLVTAGALTILIFRLLNPYTFMGPGVFGLSINPRWLADVGQGQHLISGRAEMPPNWQWVGRAEYFYPWWNMVMWGMGLPFGLAGWLSWGWAGYRLVRMRVGGLTNITLFIWILGYFLVFGRQWVTSMRYFLPLYPALAVLAGWGLLELARRAQHWPVRRSAAYTLMGAVMALTVVWGLMFSNVYRSMFTVAQAGHWVWEQVSGDFSMRVDGSGPDVPLMNIGLANGYGQDRDLVNQATRFENGQYYTLDVVAPIDGLVSTVFAPHLGDPFDDDAPESLRVTIGDPTTGAVLSQGLLVDNLVRETNIVGESYQIPLEPALVVEAGRHYSFKVEVVEGGPVISSGETMAWEGDWDEVVPPKTCPFPEGITLADNPPSGLSDIRCNGRDVWGSLVNGYKLQIIYDDIPAKLELMQETLDNTDYIIIGTNRRYDSQNRLPGRWPMTMRYYDALFSGELGYDLVATFEETYEFGPLKFSDQYLPTYDAPQWLNELEAEEAFHVYDHPVVYLFRKNATRYTPANTADILGEVPLNTVNTFLPASNGLTGLNCPDGDIDVNYYCNPLIVGVAPLKAEGVEYSLSADQAPTAIRLTEDMLEAQTEGGTWSNRFDSDSLLNTQPVLTVLVWWLAMMAFGWAIWPLLFIAFPGLADRGYGFAKFTGMFVTGWLAWLVASAQIPVWSQGGIAFALLLVVLASVWAVRQSRGEFIAYVREHSRRLLGFETLALVLFICFLLVRLSNPDLWHTAYGGEKPMDFAYFNGVLRSTVFPPLDPWQSGGYINYYYFGFVIVGTPTLLLGIIPSIAYNLIVPTLFSVTGTAAFSVAYNAVSAWRGQRRELSSDDTEPETEKSRPLFSSGASPWIAGIAALLLAVVLGNLDTPRVMMNELAVMGGYTAPATLQDYLVQEYTETYGVSPSGQAMVDIINQAMANNTTDELRYELSVAWNSVGSVVGGLRKVLGGAQLSVSPNRWFWAPTRVLMELPVDSGNAIAEMPYFTFVYGDLHAHMIAMPMQFIVMAFVLNELLLARRDERNGRAYWLALALGAVVTGMLRATNTWDWVTMTVLGVVGLTYAWHLRWRRIHRRSLVNLVMWVGGFVAIGALAVLPFTMWFASGYNRVLPWEGRRTPIWAYFDIHGLFIFMIVSLLLWDTVRWLRQTRVRELRGTAGIITGLVVFGGLLFVAVVAEAMRGYQVTLIVIPLILWIALLFFRRGQNPVMQFMLALAGLGLILSLVVEYVVLDGDIGRQNTVFKFYIQVWLLFSVVGGAAFAWLWDDAQYWGWGWRFLWTTPAMFLIFIAALFPIMSTAGKSVYRMAPEMPLTLDGMDYMRYASYYEGNQTIIQTDPTRVPFNLDDDYAVIRWLQENVQGSPVIMEGRSRGGGEYLWGSRISIYTGLPSILGWRYHQSQQHTFYPLSSLTERRVANVNAFYVTSKIGEAWDILDYYDVRYVIVSDLERAYYTATNLSKLDEMVRLGLLEIVFEHGDAVIYQVNSEANYEETDRAGLVGS